MKTVKMISILLAATLMQQAANAKNTDNAKNVGKTSVGQLANYGSGFTAPNVNGTASIPTPFSGDIIYNTADSTFYGSTGSSWTAFGGASTAVPAGTISAFAGTAAPSGYVLCDGSAISRTTYAALFAVIGTSFGQGDGSTTFNVPDLRGRFIRGVDGSAGRDPDKNSRSAMNTGGNTGNNVGSVQGYAFQDHTHNFATQVGAGGSAQPAPGNGTYYAAGTTGGASGSVSTETRPVNANVNFIIKL